MADNEVVCLLGKPLSSLRVLDLRQELEKRGLSKAGNKNQLVDRLAPQLLLEELQNAPVKDQDTVPNLKLQEEIGSENEYIRQYLTQQQHLYEIQKEAKRRAELESEQVQAVVSEKAIDFSDHGPSHFSDNSSLECESNLDFDVQKEEPLPPALFLEGATIDRSADRLIKLDILNEPEYPLPPKLEREETFTIKMEKNKRRSSRIETILEFEGEKSGKRRKQCQVVQKATVNKTERSKRKAEAIQLTEELKEKIQEKRQKYSNIENTKPQINKFKDFPLESKNIKGVKKDDSVNKRTVRSVNKDKILVLEIEQLNDEIISEFTRAKKPKELIARKQQKIIEAPKTEIVKPNRLIARKQQNTNNATKTEITGTNRKTKSSRRNSSVEAAPQLVLEDFRVTDYKKLKKQKQTRKKKSSIIEEVLRTPATEFIDNRTRHKKSPRTQNIKENSEIVHEAKTVVDNKIMESKKSSRTTTLKRNSENRIETEESIDNAIENKKLAKTSNVRGHSKNHVETNEFIDINTLKSKKLTRVSSIKQSGNHLDIKESTDNTIIKTKGSQRTQRARGNPEINFENKESINIPIKSARSRRASIIREQAEILLETKESIDNPVENIKKSPRTLIVRGHPENNKESNVNTEVKSVRSRKNPTQRGQPETRLETKESVLKSKRSQRISTVRGTPETPLETKESIDTVTNKSARNTPERRRHQETNLKPKESVDNTEIKTVRSRKAPALREKPESNLEAKESINNAIIENMKKSPRNPTIRGRAESNLETNDFIDNITTKNLLRPKTVRGHPGIDLETKESIDIKVTTKKSTRAPALRGLQSDDSIDNTIARKSRTTTVREHLLNKETIDNTIITKKSSRATTVRRHPETDIETKETTDNKGRATRIRGYPEANIGTKESIDNSAVIRKTARTTRKRYTEVDLETEELIDNKEITKKSVRAKRARGHSETDVKTKEYIDNSATKKSERTTRKYPETDLEAKKRTDNKEIVKTVVRAKRARGHSETDVETKESINNSATTKKSERTTRKYPETNLETKKLSDNKEIAKTFVGAKRVRGHPTTDVDTKESIDNPVITKKASRNTSRNRESDLETEKPIDDKVIIKKARTTNIRGHPETDLDNSAITKKSARTTTIRGHQKTDMATEKSIDNTVITKNLTKRTAVKEQLKTDRKTKEFIDNTGITNKAPRRYRGTVVETKESIDNIVTKKSARTISVRGHPETKESIDNKLRTKKPTSIKAVKGQETNLETKESADKTARRQRGIDIETEDSIVNTIIKKSARATTDREHPETNFESKESNDNIGITKKSARATTVRVHPESDLGNKESIDDKVIAKKSTIKTKKAARDTTVSAHPETEESFDNAVATKKAEISTIAIDHLENIEITKINKKSTRDTMVRGHAETEKSIDNTLITKKATIDTSVIEYPEKDIEIKESTDNTLITKTLPKIASIKQSEALEIIKTNKKSTKIPSLKDHSENENETKELIDDKKIKNAPISPEELVLGNEHLDKNIKPQDELKLQMRNVKNISKDIINPQLETEDFENLKKDSTLESNLTKNVVEKLSIDSTLNETKEPAPEQIVEEINNLQTNNVEHVNNEIPGHSKISEAHINKDSDTIKEFNNTLKVVDQQLEENSLKSISEEFKVRSEISSLYILEGKLAADLCTKQSLDDATTKNSGQFIKERLVELNLCDENVAGKLKDSSLKLHEEKTEDSYADDKQRDKNFLEIIKSNNKELESNLMKSKTETNNLLNTSHVEVKAVPYLIKDILDENKTETMASFENVKNQQANLWEGKSMNVKIKDPFEDSKQIESDNSLESFEELVGSKNKQVEIKNNTLTEEGQTDGDFETFQEILEQAALTTYQEVEQLGDESSEFIQKPSETSTECSQREIDPPLSHIEDISKDSCENIPLFNKRCDDIQELIISEKCIYQEPSRSTNFPLLVQDNESIKPEVSKKYDLGNVNFLAIDSEKALKKDFDGAFEVNKSETCHNIFSVQEPSNIEDNFIYHKNLKVDHLPEESSKNNEQNRYEQTAICEIEKQTNIGAIEEKYENKSNLSQDWNPYETWKTSATNNPENIIEKINSEPESQNMELSRNRSNEKFMRQEQVVMNREPSRISDSSSSTTSSRRSRSKERFSTNNDRSTVIYRNRNRSRSRSPSREIPQTSHSREHYHRNQDASQQVGSRERVWFPGNRERDQQMENRERPRQNENRDSYRRSGGRESFQPFNRREGSWGNQSWENQGWENQSWENQSWERPWQSQSREMPWQNRSRERPPRSRSRERSWQPGGRERSQF